MRIKIFVPLLFAIIISCKEKSVETPAKVEETIKFLPFQQIDLDDLGAFKEVTENWKVAGSSYVDRSKDRMLSSNEGTGVLVNNPEEGKNDNIFTNLEHGDIELEVDVMMPKGSNSGLYFQGRYEVQLFDSWGVEAVHHSDMGGIYQRWDSSKEKGQEGFEGYAPKKNAAKAPGLWQNLKILFHAPKFDTSGRKTGNAIFEEVWLNGVLIHKNIEVSGPTRAAAFQDEKPKGPLMVQGDHGPVALKNMRYKTYDDEKVSLGEITMAEYENKSVLLPSFDSITAVRTVDTDSLSAQMATGERPQKILKY